MVHYKQITRKIIASIYICSVFLFSGCFDSELECGSDSNRNIIENIIERKHGENVELQLVDVITTTQDEKTGNRSCNATAKLLIAGKTFSTPIVYKVYKLDNSDSTHKVSLSSYPMFSTFYVRNVIPYLDEIKLEKEARSKGFTLVAYKVKLAHEAEIQKQIANIIDRQAALDESEKELTSKYKEIQDKLDLKKNLSLFNKNGLYLFPNNIIEALGVRVAGDESWRYYEINIKNISDKQLYAIRLDGHSYDLKYGKFKSGYATERYSNPLKPGQTSWIGIRSLHASDKQKPMIAIGLNFYNISKNHNFVKCALSWSYMFEFPELDNTMKKISDREYTNVQKEFKNMQRTLKYLQDEREQLSVKLKSLRENHNN